jgi:hypothetical protein
MKCAAYRLSSFIFHLSSFRFFQRDAMGLLLKLLTLPVTGPIDSVIWLADKMAEQAENELYNESAVRAKLMELELRYEMGEIGEDEFNQAEEELLALLKTIRERRAG